MEQTPSSRTESEIGQKLFREEKSQSVRIVIIIIVISGRSSSRIYYYLFSGREEEHYVLEGLCTVQLAGRNWLLKSC